ncbi:low molecular weight phosphatase family protein [Nonomuraea roseoviolacea subsp. carminata]
MTGGAMTGTFRVLFVCTGNLCRSPLAERLARATLGPGFVVESAGTRAVPGLPMPEHARRTLLRLGGDPSGFASRPLTAALVAEADLVLAATVLHRAEVVALHLPAATRAFTIAEFGVLAAEADGDALGGDPDPVCRARTLVDQAAALRGLVRVDVPDIADPYGRSRWAYRAAGRRIAEALAVPLRLLTHPPVS